MSRLSLTPEALSARTSTCNAKGVSAAAAAQGDCMRAQQRGWSARARSSSASHLYFRGVAVGQQQYKLGTRRHVRTACASVFLVQLLRHTAK